MRILSIVLAAAMVSAAVAEEPAKDEAAEALFKKVEAKYADAKTVQYKVEMVGKDKDDTIKMTITVASKGEGLFKLSGAGDFGGKEVKMTVVCDGTNLDSRLNGQGGTKKSSATAGTILRGGMVRTGIFEGLDSIDRKSLGSMEEQYPVTELKLGADEKVGDKAVKVLTYKVGVKGKDRSWTQKIWVDAESLVIVKREGTGTDGRTESETYSDTKFDGELKDEDFKVADEEDEDDK